MGEFTNISYIQKLFDDYSHEKSFNEELPSDCDVDLFPNQFVYEELIKNKLSHKDNKVIPFLLKFSIDNFISFISFETFTLSLVKKFNCVYHNKSISVSLKTEDNSEILFNGFRLGPIPNPQEECTEDIKQFFIIIVYQLIVNIY